MRLLPGIPLVLVLCATPGAAAQGIVEPTTTVDRAQMGSRLGDTDRAPWDVGGWVRTPAGAFTTSLVLPGAAQAAFGAHRWAVYGALELAVWTLRIRSQGEHRDATAAYRDLAWEVARLQGEYPRRDGSWGYYEAMTQYVRSGAFDRDPLLDGIQPEPDPDTYNGAVWTLARALYLPGGAGEPGTPEYAQAVAYYSARAVGPDLLWSWEGNEAARERFRSLIGDADEASRTAGLALGAVLANHLVSAVDALIIARLRTDAGIRLESRVTPADPLRWSVALRIPIQDDNGRFR